MSLFSRIRRWWRGAERARRAGPRPYQPRLEGLEVRDVLSSLNLLGVGSQVGGHVKAYSVRLADEVASFIPFPGFTGTVLVATGDVFGSPTDDLVVSVGLGGPPHVKVYEGDSVLAGTPREVVSFLVFGAGFTGGVFVATGDIMFGGKKELIVGANAGAGPNVRVFNVAAGGAGTQIPGPLGSFFAFDPAFRGGVRVAAADLNQSTISPGEELVAAVGKGTVPRVNVFNGSGSMFTTFLAYDAAFRDGVFVAAGQLDGDSAQEIVVGAGSNARSDVRIYEINPTTGAQTLQANFLGYVDNFFGGVRVGLVDITGDGALDVMLGPGPSIPAQLRTFAAGSVISLLNPFGDTYLGGMFCSM